jgi:23S rRNA pseudouridine2605 synthase
MNQKMQIRINKYLSDCGIASRRKVEELILQGRVMVNNKIVSDLATKIDSENDKVRVDGELVSVKNHVYYLLNKPKGIITTTKDDKGRTTVVDLIKSDRSIYPIGRLDFNTTGVLLLTNDGNFSYLLSHPKHKVPREYDVKLDRELTEDDRKRLISGITLDKKKSRFESISSPQKKNKILVRVKCHEGRNHFVKRMFASLGYTVKSLNRCSYAGLTADIPIGAYRKLSLSEINKIKNSYAL